MPHKAKSTGLDTVLVGTEVNNLFPVLQRRKQGSISPALDSARRELWRAYQRGSLSEAELERTLDRMDFSAIH